MTEGNDLDFMGPVDYLIIEFPGSKMTGEGFPLLIDLVDREIIRILDFLFIKKELNGTVAGIALTDLDDDGELDLAIFEGASSGLLGQDDIEETSAVLEPGSSAAIVVYENLWAAPLARALRQSGGQVIASGRVSVDDLLEALEVAEAEAIANSAQ